MHPNRATKAFADAAEKAGVSISLKALRSFALTTITDAVSLAEAAAWAGHKDLTTTARHYAGRTSTGADNASAAVDAALAPSPALTA